MPYQIFSIQFSLIGKNDTRIIGQALSSALLQEGLFSLKQGAQRALKN